MHRIKEMEEEKEEVCMCLGDIADAWFVCSY